MYLVGLLRGDPETISVYLQSFLVVPVFCLVMIPYT